MTQLQNLTQGYKLSSSTNMFFQSDMITFLSNLTVKALKEIFNLIKHINTMYF